MGRWLVDYEFVVESILHGRVIFGKLAGRFLGFLIVDHDSRAGQLMVESFFESWSDSFLEVVRSSIDGVESWSTRVEYLQSYNFESWSVHHRSTVDARVERMDGLAFFGHGPPD